MTEFYALKRYKREPRGFNWPLLYIVIGGIVVWFFAAWGFAHGLVVVARAIGL